jgi:uncharacterized circularly permuted ATP-grasp superfamily protein/uncharacterized alpha-E superfamily protein
VTENPPRPSAGFARGYQPLAGVLDEMSDAQGQVRPSWRKLLAWLDALGDADLARRWDKARQLIHENGVSYNVYGDPQGMERPWNLSPLPVVLGATDWQSIVRGLMQRARLLSKLLGDLYGPQRMLLDGKLPPELVFTNPYYLRALHGQPVPLDDWLPLYGADLMRAPDGHFHILEDRAQAPTGAGYALENRIVVSSALPELLRECNVERLAPFFRALRETLQELAPHNRDNPRIVLLTPGPYDVTYFEQAYFAQYLGLTLAAGADLTVRDDRVFLKTLGALLPVDVIFRRVNDDSCDPLELRADSLLGVPGLVQAARAGNVSIANPLGTGLVQSPALLPYLPAICRELLGEELAMPSVRTWWCGDPKQLAEALAHFDNLCIRPTFWSGSTSPVVTSSLAAVEREQLIAQIKARPSSFVAQEQLTPSTTPLLVETGVEPRSFSLRCYAISAHSGEYLVMPGGLARVAASENGLEMTLQRGARSKDVWVLSNEPVSTFSMMAPSSQAIQLSRGGGDLPSRAADNLYWLGRYAERAEGVARLARVIGARLADVAGQPELDRSTEFGAMLAALRAQTEFLYAADIPHESAPSLESAEAQVIAAVRDPKSNGSLASIVAMALRAGRLVRDRISLDTWRVLATLDESIGALEHPEAFDRLGTLVGLLNRVVVTLAGFSGLAMESMTRGQGWHFLDMGRRIERAITLVTLLRATTARTLDRERPLLEAVLEIADSGMTYRRRYLASLQLPPVLDLLLTDDTNPRSVLYQLRALGDHIRELPPPPGTAVRNPQLKLVLAAQNELELAEMDELSKPDELGARPKIEALLRRLGTLLPQLSDSLSDTYLNHATVARHLSQETP